MRKTADTVLTVDTPDQVNRAAWGAEKKKLAHFFNTTFLDIDSQPCKMFDICHILDPCFYVLSHLHVRQAQTHSCCETAQCKQSPQTKLTHPRTPVQWREFSSVDSVNQQTRAFFRKNSAMTSIEGVWAAQDLKVKLFYSQYKTFLTAVLFCMQVNVNPFLNLFEQVATLLIENMDFSCRSRSKGMGKTHGE